MGARWTTDCCGARGEGGQISAAMHAVKSTAPWLPVCARVVWEQVENDREMQYYGRGKFLQSGVARGEGEPGKRHKLKLKYRISVLQAQPTVIVTFTQ